MAGEWKSFAAQHPCAERLCVGLFINKGILAWERLGRAASYRRSGQGGTQSGVRDGGGEPELQSFAEGTFQRHKYTYHDIENDIYYN